MQLRKCLPAVVASSAGAGFFKHLGRCITDRSCGFYSVALEKSTSVESASSTISSSQLIRLNLSGTLPSVARKWDNRTFKEEQRNVDAASCTEQCGPTAVQRELAKRHGVVLPAGASRHTAAATLATVRPPSIRSLAVLYGPLEYDGDVPASDAAARQLMRVEVLGRPQGHPLDSDLSPVASSQVYELFNRLGYIGRLPYSYGSAQLMAVCLRTILADVDDEARLRPLPSLDSRQVDLIRYLRSRRSPPGTRGMPAVLDVDLAAQPPVSRLAAARNILQLLQNHELCATPTGSAVEALRNLGHDGPVPPTTGEALMLAGELRDRCLAPTAEQVAALRAAGYGTPAADPAAAAVPPPPLLPYPDSVAHVKALLRVLRRADTDAATPATRTALRHLGELRRRAPASAAAAAAAAATAPWAACGGGGGGGGRSGGVDPCPSQLEVRAAIEDLPLSEAMMERLFDLGWPGPMPETHGSALALEDYLLQQKTTAVAAAPPPGRHAYTASQAVSPPPSPFAESAAGAAVRRPGVYGMYDNRSSRQHHFVSRLGSSPEEALVKIQIRGMFPGAISEWYLRTMSYDEAEHVLACLMAARRVVLERAAVSSYDEYVERWSEAEVEGDWWGMEWLWH
ncbi:hypothetical protein PLESTM_000270800 [Pleodorina starrii]|nr:hypothetical protein PLESTM_000270800 [Pleodorina starrii]